MRYFENSVRLSVKECDENANPNLLSKVAIAI